MASNHWRLMIGTGSRVVEALEGNLQLCYRWQPYWQGWLRSASLALEVGGGGANHGSALGMRERRSYRSSLGARRHAGEEKLPISPRSSEVGGLWPWLGRGDTQWHRRPPIRLWKHAGACRRRSSLARTSWESIEETLSGGEMCGEMEACSVLERNQLGRPDLVRRRTGRHESHRSLSGSCGARAEAWEFAEACSVRPGDVDLMGRCVRMAEGLPSPSSPLR